MAKGWRKQFCKNGHETAVIGRDKHGKCPLCVIEYRQKHIEDLKKSHAKLYEREKDEIKERVRKYQFEHKEEIKNKNKNYYELHKEKILARNKKWNTEHRADLLESYLKRRDEDINFKIACNLRSRIRTAIKSNYKAGSAVKDLGCTIEFFRQYIQSKFYVNMTWDNWGTVWELDHIKELHTFDLIDLKQFLEACHYTNFQPLTIEDHLKKTTQKSCSKI